MAERSIVQPLIAGVVTALVGFASTFALVLAGLRAVGASSDQAASGLLALCVAVGVVAIALGLWMRLPVAIAWSTPGAALLISAGAQDGGFRAAVGAFVLAGLLIVLCGLWAALGRWIAAIPVSLASAMLAGVLLPVCLAPVHAVVEVPWQAGPVVATWVAFTVVARRWAVPAAMAATIVVIAVGGDLPAGALDHPWPVLALTAPSVHLGAIVGLGLPLFVVTMASQNVPGMGVLASFGYRPPLRPILLSTGAATVVGAPFGAHAINLAAISAALAAGPDADPDPSRRWIASVTAGGCMIVLGLCAGLATVLVASAPPVLIEGAAGLALMGTLGGALSTALSDAPRREAATLTFVVSASAITIAGISSPFWGLLTGLGFLAVSRIGAIAPRGRG